MSATTSGWPARHPIRLTIAAFVLGVSTGGLVLGQKSPPDSLRPDALVTTTAHHGAEITSGPPVEQVSEEAIAASVVDIPPKVGVGIGVNGTETEPQTESVIGSLAEAESDEDQVQLLIARWNTVQTQLTRLSQRIEIVESELAATRAAAVEENPDDPRYEGVQPVDTPERRRSALIDAGVLPADAEEIVWRQSTLAMEQLELQDRATREGWYRSERYYEAARELGQQALNLRAEVGAQAYDRYLFQTGQPNRVKINSIIAGSSAEQTGLMPGDVIESYAGEPVFDADELRNATAQGSREEVVPLVIRRGEQVFETELVRGPIGVRIEAEVIPPDT